MSGQQWTIEGLLDGGRRAIGRAEADARFGNNASAKKALAELREAWAAVTRIYGGSDDTSSGGTP